MQSRSHVVKLFNECVLRLKSNEWADLSTCDRQLTMGILAVLGGWKPQVKAGASVRIRSGDDSYVTGTVVDAGHGRTQVGVIIDDHEKLLQRV